MHFKEVFFFFNLEQAQTRTIPRPKKTTFDLSLTFPL